MDRIITYSFCEDLIKNLAEYAQKECLEQKKELSRVAFVFGGRRPSLFLKKELSRRLRKSFFPPAFFSIDEFVKSALLKKGPFLPAADLDACFIIYNLAKELSPAILKGKEAFSSFLPWAQEILAFIEQMDLEAVEPGLLKNVQFNARIGYDIPENINVLLGNIISLREDFHKILKKKNMYSRGLMYLSAREYIRQVDFCEFDRILFCGFLYLHKTEEDIIKSLYDAGKAELFFQGSAQDWSILRRASKRFSCFLEPEKKRKPEYKLSVQAGFDVHSQACLVREVLKKIKNPDKTVVVLPEPDNMVPLLSEISCCVEDFNVSMGYPLSRSSLYSLFESMFKAQETKKEDEYYTRDYLEVLRHPFVKNLKFFLDASAVRVLTHKVEEVLLGMHKTSLGGSLFVKLSDIAGLDDLYRLALDATDSMNIKIDFGRLQEILGKLHKLFFLNWEEVSNFYDFSLVLGGFLEALVGNNSLGSYPLNLETAEKIFCIKEELLGCAFNKEVFAKEDIFRIFKNRLRNAKISFSGSPLKGLQVLGLLETRSLNFENVIVMDVNEGVLPNTKIYQPLVPKEVMINLGLKRFEKEDEIQRYHFQRLISSAKNVYLIYQQRPEKEKSRYIEELLWREQKKGAGSGIFPSGLASFRTKVSTGKPQAPKNRDIIEFLRNFQYSASSVNSYLHCPLSFYYRYVLGLREKEDLFDEPEAADIGTFVHELLEEVFSGFIGRKPRIDAKFRKWFFGVLNRKFQNEFKRKMKSDSFLIRDVFDFRMKSFLDKESQRDVKEIICLEKMFKADIKLGSGVFKFKAVIDRIDKLSDESILILDYKTGGSDIMPETSIEKIELACSGRGCLKKTVKSFQLPLYVYLAGNDKFGADKKINAALYPFKDIKKEGSFKKLFNDENQLRDKQRIMQAYFRALDFLFCEILNPDIPFEADEENQRYCKMCQFFYMCR